MTNILLWLLVGCVHKWQDWGVSVVRAPVQVHQRWHHWDHRADHSGQTKCLQEDPTGKHHKAGHHLQCPEQHRRDSDAQHVLCPPTIHCKGFLQVSWVCNVKNYQTVSYKIYFLCSMSAPLSTSPWRWASPSRELRWCQMTWAAMCTSWSWRPLLPGQRKLSISGLVLGRVTFKSQSSWTLQNRQRPTTLAR